MLTHAQWLMGLILPYELPPTPLKVGGQNYLYAPHLFSKYQLRLTETKTKINNFGLRTPFFACHIQKFPPFKVTPTLMNTTQVKFISVQLYNERFLIRLNVTG